MKKKARNNSNGIQICDSIVMSVKKRRPNYRMAEAVIIAVIGYVSVIMSFLTMFDFTYSRTTVFVAGAIFSFVYIILSVIGKKGAWIITASLFVAMVMAYRVVDTLALGFKYVYNVIYHAAYHTDISYYKALKPRFEENSVTLFFIFMMWILAVVIYFFTIYRPNPFLPLLATFPIIEIGLYYGIEISVFWGILVIAYWLALLAMSSIDMGEYSGGNGGFVRKDDLFFPKRQMRLKVTEKCGMFVIASIAAVALVTTSVIKLTDYKRSDEINRKRIAIRDAVASFSMENIADSLSNLTSAFGIDLRYEDHKLGNVDRLRYKNTVDLVVEVSGKYEGAIYLKDFTGAVYSGNEWQAVPASLMDQQLFTDFRELEVYPQEFPALFSRTANIGQDELTISIENKEKKRRTYFPYGTLSDGSVKFSGDDLITPVVKNSKYSYRFIPISTENAAAALKAPIRNVFSVSSVTDSYWQSSIRQFCTDRALFSYDDYFSIDSEIGAGVNSFYAQPKTLMAQLLESEYKQLVRDNYMQVPADANITEVRELFQDILDDAPMANNAADKLAILTRLRERVGELAVYSLDPGKTPSNRDFVNYFLTENKKGYCTHFATTGVLLARMAGIPARYATGYVVVGDDFSKNNRSSDGSYTIEIKDNRSHAWTEVYLDGFGWMPFEFTAGYSEETINTSPATTTLATTTNNETKTTASRSRSSGETSKRQTRTTQTRTTAAVSASTTVSGGGSSHRSHEPMTMGQKSIIVGTIFLLAAAAFVWLRRKFILWRRDQRFTVGAARERVGAMYEYAMALLKMAGAVPGTRTYTAFTEDMEKSLGGIRFPEGEFAQFMDICLRTIFSDENASKEELEKCRSFVTALAGNTYEKAGRAEKLIMKLITVLI
ncbi:MAG: transglutaminase domain-containing protein [Ruminococcus sp.]|nr:transglutaminase domain-containing protein [Ruminococcus sp.]